MYDRNKFVDTNQKSVSFQSFIDDEMIHFSKYDCDRSIPNMVDGLKVSQRKILFSAFKKRLHQEIKVAQFSGYVSEHSGYHHGEQSLNGAIINMAQNFVGSNNINLLEPNGQFGTRLQGGKDHASRRYIFTRLSHITRNVFPPEDDAILKYLDDDGQMVEPVYYVPIIPMILVNGAVGIGTGFSTKIPCYDPKTLINIVIIRLKTLSISLKKISSRHTKISRDTLIRLVMISIRQMVYMRLDQVENPLLLQSFRLEHGTKIHLVFLEKLLNAKNSVLKDYNDKSTDKDVYIELILAKKIKDANIPSVFKLQTTISTTNMNLFNEQEQLVPYKKINDIINNFMDVRHKTYVERKEYIINNLEHEIMIITNKYKYILEILNDAIDLRKKSSQQINEMLNKKEYDLIDKSYNYLIKMPMDSVNIENVERLKNEVDEKNKQLNILKETTIQEMWLSELARLEKSI